MRRNALIAAALLALTTSMVFGAPTAAAEPVEVTIHHFVFDRPVVQAAKGQEVKWTNVEPLGTPHNVVTQAYAPPGGAPVAKTLVICRDMAANGKPCSRKDLAPGTYLYTCTINQAHTLSMHGVLVIS